MIIPFEHHPQAHSESGVTSNLLKFHGLSLSEPMTFGIGSGLFFGHIPFIKVNGVPGTTYRIYPGQIFKNVCNRLGIQYQSTQFRTSEQAMKMLDENLNQNIPTGCQVSVFHLPFLPEVFRFHFNAHNLIVFGKEQNTYHVSDPVMENKSIIESADLAKARFAKGFPEPKGRMYSISKIGKDYNLEKAIYKGIAQTCFFLLSPPLPWFGVNAIKFLSKKIGEYPQKLTPRQTSLYLGNIIRMQEEIGTGGAGFRYLYAAFLQEVGKTFSLHGFIDLSEQMTLIGDKWRNMAYQTARICKARSSDVGEVKDLSSLLYEIYHLEKNFFAELKKANKQLSH